MIDNLAWMISHISSHKYDYTDDSYQSDMLSVTSSQLMMYLYFNVITHFFFLLFTVSCFCIVWNIFVTKNKKARKKKTKMNIFCIIFCLMLKKTILIVRSQTFRNHIVLFSLFLPFYFFLSFKAYGMSVSMCVCLFCIYFCLILRTESCQHVVETTSINFWNDTFYNPVFEDVYTITINGDNRNVFCRFEFNNVSTVYVWTLVSNHLFFSMFCFNF